MPAADPLLPTQISSSPPSSPSTPAPAVRCRGLVKRWPGVVAVDGVDLAVARGECFGLLGPNGAGKTTTLEILEGLTEADEGVVEVLGVRWGEGRDRELRARLGIQLQETQLPELLKVVEVVRLFRSFTPTGRTVDEVIELVALGEKRTGRVGKLSGGQKQRLALACALVGAPDLLFLDEPTTGLDPQARRKIWDLVEGFRAAGGTVLLTTHAMDEAARLCDRLAILDHGKVIAQGTPGELVASLGAEQIVEVRLKGQGRESEEREELGRAGDGEAEAEGPGATPVEGGDLAALPGVRGATRRGDAWVLTVTEIGSALPSLLALLEARGATIETLSTHQATLEDVFVHLTGRALRDG